MYADFFAFLAKFYSSGHRLALYFGVETVGAALQRKFRKTSSFFLEQLALHRVDAGFLHLSGCYYERVLAEADGEIIVGVLGGIG